MATAIIYVLYVVYIYIYAIIFVLYVLYIYIYICTAIIDVCASENHAKHSKRKVVDVCFFEKHKKNNKKRKIYTPETPTLEQLTIARNIYIEREIEEERYRERETTKLYMYIIYSVFYVSLSFVYSISRVTIAYERHM